MLVLDISIVTTVLCLVFWYMPEIVAYYRQLCVLANKITDMKTERRALHCWRNGIQSYSPACLDIEHAIVEEKKRLYALEIDGLDGALTEVFYLVYNTTRVAVSLARRVYNI